VGVRTLLALLQKVNNAGGLNGESSCFFSIGDKVMELCDQAEGHLSPLTSSTLLPPLPRRNAIGNQANDLWLGAN